MLKKAKTIPSGFEYYTIRKSRRINNYKKKIQSLLESKNMIEFLPPLMDYMELFLLTTNSLLNGTSYFTEKLFEVKDSNGELLSIRSDLTVMAMKSFLYHQNEINSIQYYYIQPVYRDFPDGTGFYREILQAGVEWIGSFPDRIPNLFSLAKELISIFPTPCTFVFGNANFLKKFLELFPEESHKEILNAFYYKDTEKLKNINKKYSIPDPLKNILIELPFLIGTKPILKELKILLNGFPELLKIIQSTILETEENIMYDFTIVREFSYYTGLIFEAYMNHNNIKVLTGGIYDNFSLQLSDLEIPSCGFAINLTEFINCIEEES